MFNKINRVIYSFFFLAMIILSAWASHNNAMSRDIASIMMLVSNIGLMMNAEYGRRADRDEKEDERRNALSAATKTFLHG